MPDIRAWSTTAADNDDADAAINWLEGQLPSTVNGSARAMMAAVRGTLEGPDSKDNGLEWWDSGMTPTRTGNTTFTVTGDMTAKFVEGRRLRLTDSSTIYATVVSSAYTSLTTVTVVTDSGNLSASLTKVFLSPQMPSSVSAPAIFGKNDYALTTGTSTAYTASFTPKIPALTNGVSCRVRLHTACGATPTFAPDGLTAKSIKRPGNVALASGDQTADSVLDLTYVSALDVWIIDGQAIPAATPPPLQVNGTIQTGNFNAAAGYIYMVNTAGGAITATLDASPTQGQRVGFIDATGTFGTNNLTLGRNGKTIDGSAANFVLNMSRIGHVLDYNATAGDWRVS